jgi:selenocysteine-specific elongation factor
MRAPGAKPTDTPNLKPEARTRSIVVGTAGHIDHGKSALVRALTGTDPDRLKEEKARGITIDLGFAHLVHHDIQFSFVDVPGHERFVKNMLAGAGGIDLVVLVVAADESVMPQTREHFDICRLLRVRAGVVALTKADLVDAEGLDIVRLEVRELVSGSFLDGAAIVAVSSRTGEGLDTLRAALVGASATVPERPAAGPPRLPVDRVFSVRGFGTVVTGTLVSGRIGMDDDLRLEPGGRRVSVRGVQVHGERRQAAWAGERTALNVAGIEVGDVERGQVLTAPGAFEPTRVVDAVVEMLPGAPALKHGGRVRFHHGTAEILGRVAIIAPALPDGRAPVLAAGSQGFIRLRLEHEAVLTRGDRYILRAYSPPLTIAGGWILDPKPPRGGVRAAAAASRCASLAAGPPGTGEDALEAARVMIEAEGRKGLPTASLVSRAGVEPSAIARQVDRLVRAGHALAIDDVLVSPPVLHGLKTAIVETLSAHHRAEPLSAGVPREQMRDQLFARGRAAIFDRATAEMIRDGVIAGTDRLMLAGHRVVLSQEEERASEVIERALREGDLTPPDVSTVAAAAGIPPAVAQRVVQLLQRQKRAVKIDDLWFHDDALRGLKQRVGAFKAGAAIDVATFKQTFGVTRKFAIPLLEYLDRERVTRRVGDRRLIL